MPRCLPGSLRSVQILLDHLVEMRARAVCHQHSNGRSTYKHMSYTAHVIQAHTMCLYDGTQWCSVCGEEEGSNNWSLRYPSDQLMCSGFLPSPGHLEGSASEIGFKPAKWNPCDAQWCAREWLESKLSAGQFASALSLFNRWQNSPLFCNNFVRSNYSKRQTTRAISTNISDKISRKQITSHN